MNGFKLCRSTVYDNKVLPFPVFLQVLLQGHYFCLQPAEVFHAPVKNIKNKNVKSPPNLRVREARKLTSKGCQLPK